MTDPLGAQAPVTDGGTSRRKATGRFSPILERPNTISRGANGSVTVRAVAVTGLVVDGALDEPSYRTTPPIGDFIQLEPEPGAQATERTEAWAFFDDTNLYVAIRASDSAPESEWVANDMQRDSLNIGQNESFAFVLDTFYDRRNGFFFNFNVNPIQRQSDRRPLGRSGNERRELQRRLEPRVDREDRAL